MTYSLAIGNKALSSWSLRAWLLLRHYEIPFNEVMVRLRRPEFKEEVKPHSPTGLVPCLRDGDDFVWDTLAIAEYLADRHPEKNMWPSDVRARAEARCVTAEMHAGFSNLRTVWPMDLSKQDLGVITPPAVRKDLSRIFTIWENARARFGADGRFLFGEFSIADAFFAPVVTRIKTYGPVRCETSITDYMDAVLTLPAMQEWARGAAEEIEAGWYKD